jgi:rhamnosyltransferase subunit B
MLLPQLRNSYEDLLSAAAGADLMLAGELVDAAPLVAEKLRIRWASVILSPFSFFSSHDPSVMVNAPRLVMKRFDLRKVWFGGGDAAPDAVRGAPK